MIFNKSVSKWMHSQITRLFSTKYLDNFANVLSLSTVYSRNWKSVYIPLTIRSGIMRLFSYIMYCQWYKDNSFVLSSELAFLLKDFVNLTTRATWWKMIDIMNALKLAFHWWCAIIIQNICFLYVYRRSISIHPLSLKHS